MISVGHFVLPLSRYQFSSTTLKVSILAAYMIGIVTAGIGGFLFVERPPRRKMVDGAWKLGPSTATYTSPIHG